MSKKTKPIELYLLKGIEDYLTDSAKKYRRNLLFSASIVLAITLFINHDWASGKQINSIFGVSLINSEGMRIGFEPRLLVAILTIIVGWEMIMFWFSKYNCDANWRGRGRSESKELMIFAPYDISSIEQYNQTCRNLVIELAELVNIKQNDIELGISNFGASLSNYLERITPDMHEELSKRYNQERRISIMNEAVIDFIKRYIDSENKRYSAFHEKLKGNVDECLSNIKRENEQWMVRVENRIQDIFQELVSSQDIFSDDLKKCSASRRTIFVEFWLPLIVGAVAFIVGMHTSKYLTILIP